MSTIGAATILSLMSELVTAAKKKSDSDAKKPEITEKPAAEA